MNVSLKSPQWEVFSCDRRFRILVAGRRFGKTYLALVELCQAAWAPGRLVWYIAPTYKQAKRIAWKPLKRLTSPYWASKPNETDLSIELCTGGTIALRGADNYDSLRGDGLDFLVMDEYASMSPDVWSEVLRPSLSDRQGRALFIGTPRGFNHFYDLFQDVQNPNWATFQFTTEQGGNVLASELQQAADEMDERTWRQEFQASFENLTEGRVYYGFDRSHNVEAQHYDSGQPICWSLDFNVNPMCSVIGQSIQGEIRVLDEMVLLQSNTWEACQQFLEKTQTWARQNGRLIVYVYGDATGDSRRSSADRTDWYIVRKFFGQHADQYHACVNVPSQNPTIKARVNAVNAMVCSHNGQRRLLIDPKCRELIKDFERVCWKSDPHGNLQADLDKSDPMRTHVSDAVGYWVVWEHPLRATVGPRSGRII